ncbi:MAG: non-proteolytic archaemetzincin-like protein [Myxococcaceae bacterium]|jgi:archaemetzincin|nr:non-proteolytic archaemetzincin-like protein [Myxococcaceae bacterium]MCA3016291.1 non-proteolytic archaemetzincin-like protein [Myxococcaceae bacterium]
MAAGKDLQLVAVGSVSVAVLRELEAPIQSVLGIGTYLGKVPLGTPTYAFNKDRSQYHTTAIMRRLLTIKDPGALNIMGVTDGDLFTPDTPLVFGEADRDSHVSVMSLFRIKGESELARRRVAVEAVHQAGHLVGLSYCEDTRCVMSLASTLAEAERRQLQLCNNCRNELVRIRR